VFEQPSLLALCQASEEEADADEIHECLFSTGEPFIIFTQAPLPAERQRLRLQATTRNRWTSNDYGRKIQASEALITVAMIRLLVAHLRRQN